MARTDLGYRPTFDINNLRQMGYFVDPVTGYRYGGAPLLLNRQNYARNEFRVNTGTLSTSASTSHDLRGGFMYEDTEEDLTRNANGWGTITLVEAGRRYQGSYYPTQNPQLSKSRTYSFFVQDNIQIGSAAGGQRRPAVQQGRVRAADRRRRNTFLTFDYGDQVQPRLGVNFNTRKGKGDKVYANYGRYYGSDQKSSARAHAPLRLVQNTPFFDATHRRADQRHHEPQHHRPRHPARPAADLHRRVAGRLRDAARRQLGPRRRSTWIAPPRTSSRTSRACCRPRPSSSTTSPTRDATTGRSPSN